MGPDAGKRALVLGAGISGLAAAGALRDRGYRTAVLEKCPSIGGLTRTVKVGEFCFDYTGHFLHLARYPSPSAIPYANLKDAEWQIIERRSFCYVAGRLVTAPIQYHLGELPAPMRKDCIDSYNTRPPLRDGSHASFREFIVSGFGQGLADVFLIPQNEKTMAVSLDTLSVDAVKRFFPPPDEPRVREGMNGRSCRPTEYNSKFWYPRRGGIELLVKGLAQGLTDLFTLEEVSEVDLQRRTVRTSKGNSWSWDVLFSSIPLRTLCARTTDLELKALARELTHSSTVTINLGLRGRLSPDLEGAHWVYVPDRSIPFYRVGFYSNISPHLCPLGHASMYAEVGVPGEEIDNVDVADLQPRVVRALTDLGWVRPRSIVCSVTHVIRCAYIHHTPQRERVVRAIKERLASYHVFPIGRYGLWDYISMEDSIHSAVSTVERVAQ